MPLPAVPVAAASASLARRRGRRRQYTAAHCE